MVKEYRPSEPGESREVFAFLYVEGGLNDFPPWGVRRLPFLGRVRVRRPNLTITRKGDAANDFCGPG